MELPQYLIEALYKFSQDVLREQEEFDRLHEAEMAASEATKVKESWISHLFRESKVKGN
jgi:hypothetical protein